MRRWLIFLLVTSASLFGLAAFAQESGAINIAFIFDASGSMMAAMEGRTRLAVAQDAFSQMIAEVPPEANTSLWVYGHRLSQDDPAASCQDIEQVISLGPLDVAAFETAVRGIRAIGYTPITTSLQLAAQTLADQPGARNTIVLVSDGEETCGGSPCLMAQALKQANIELTVNTIGFAADEITREQLQCIAEVTGGTYYDAPDAVQLGEALQSAVVPPGTVQIVDENGNQLADVPFQLIDMSTGEALGDFVGSANVPAGDYRAVVQGDSPMEAVIGVTPGETTNVIVASPAQTGLQMVDLSGQPLPGMNFSIIDASTRDWLDGGTGILELAAGDYHIRVDTAFPQEFDVTVVEGALTPVSVDPAEGLVRIVNLAGEPLPEMAFNVTDITSGQAYYGQGELRVPVGVFPIEVRTAFPTSTEVTIMDGRTTDVAVDDAEGLIRIVDLSGNPLPEMAFSITDPVSGNEYYGQGEMRAPPGDFPVRVRTAFDTLTEVTVTVGQTVDVPVDPSYGTIVMVDLTGAPLPDQAFNVEGANLNEPYYAQGELNVPPGEYSLSITVRPPVVVPVVITDGQRLEVSVNNEVGTLRLVTEDGRELPDQAFYLIEPATNEEQYATGQIQAPPGDYRIRVDQVFPYETTVTVQPGAVTDLIVDDSSGTVQLVDEQGQPLPDLALEIIREDGQSVYGYGPIAVPPGDYRARVQTGFSYQTDISVADGETVNVTVPSNGTLQLVDEDGHPLDAILYNATQQETGETLSARGPSELPPGQYTVEVFTVFPFETSVEITLGQTTDVTVNTAAGTLQLVDGDGNPLNDLLYTAMLQATGESVSARGASELPPGRYTVEIFTVFPFETEVELVDGETTDVTVDTVAGTVQLVDEQGNPLNEQLYTVTREETGETLSVRGPADLPPGEYGVEVYTVFPFTVEVDVVADDVTPVEVDTRAGTVRMADGRGNAQASTLFSITRQADGASSSARGEIEVPPGLYDVEVVADKSFTIRVEVLDGEVTTVNTVNASTDRPAP